MRTFDEIQRALDGPHGDNATLYARTAALVEAANFPEADAFSLEIMQWFVDRCKSLNISIPHLEICNNMLGVARGYYAGERFADLPVNPALYGSHGHSAPLGQLRDILLRQQHRAIRPAATLDAFSNALIASFIAVAKRLPESARYRPENGDCATLTISLIEMLSNVEPMIEEIVASFSSTSVKEYDLFRYFHHTYKQNEDNLEAASASKRSSLLNGSPADIVNLYLKETLFDDLLLQSEVPFVLPDEQRFSGHWIIAPPGRGKTTLLHGMFLSDLERDASIIVMDSKGDLINPIKNMEAIAERLILIEPDSRHPLALNPLDVPMENVPHTIALIEYILSGLLEAKFTNLQSALFRHVLPAMLQAFDHPTIETLKRVLADGLTKDEMEQLDDRLRAFFEDKVHGFNAKTYAETRSQIIWRLDFILTNDTMRAMFASPTTRLNLGEAMNSGKIILIDASKAKLGDDGSEFYQRFFLALILGAAQARSTLKPSEKLPVYCYLDECQWVRNDQKLATILDECRSQKIALILAHQRTDQITSPNVLSAMSNCAIRFANSDDEAKFLAPKLRCDAELLYSLPRGTFAAFVRDLTPRAIALNVPYRNIEDLPRMSPAKQAAIRLRMQDEYGFIAIPAIIRTAESPSSAPEKPTNATVSPAKPNTSKPRPTAVSRGDLRPTDDKPETGSTW